MQAQRADAGKAQNVSAVTGGCLCRAIQYEYVGDVGPANYCHCADCRRVTGSALNIGVRLEAASFRIVRGATKGFAKKGESGHELTRHFCPDCGSPLYTSSPKHPDFIYIKAGSLDDPLLVKPTHQNWMASAVPWRRITDDLPSYARGRP
jgi:hypothetical protein